MCTALAAAAVYALMWVGYSQDWHWQQRMDWSLLDAARDSAVKHPFWVRFWADVSFALGPRPAARAGHGGGGGRPGHAQGAGGAAAVGLCAAERTL